MYVGHQHDAGNLPKKLDMVPQLKCSFCMLYARKNGDPTFIPFSRHQSGIEVLKSRASTVQERR